MAANSRGRLYLLVVFFISIGAIFAAKLFFVQVIAGEKYLQTAAKQYRGSFNRTFNRGSIFFTAKDGALVSGATLRSGFVLAIEPALIKDPESTYARLRTILPDLRREEFLTRAAKTDDPYEEISRDLSEAAAASVRALGLEGVRLIEERYRSYPGGALAAHVLGFMAYQGDDYGGRYGLEKQYDALLRRDNEPSFTSFLFDLLAGVDSDSASGKTRSGADVVLTIEPSVQRFLENQLEKLAADWQSREVGGIVLEPKTGAILALAARPTFNPGQKQDDLSVLNNPLVERVYEMGSIVKLLTVAAGLDAGVVSETTVYDDTGRLLIDGQLVRNYDDRARGRVPLQEILNQSLNTGAVFVMRELGRDRFRDYFLNGFGLGRKTGIDLPAEISGLVGNLSKRRDLEFATASFGQGLALTPLNITVALSSLANDGYLVRPRLVNQLRYDTGLTEDRPPVSVGQAVTAETARRLTAMLVKVVDEVLDGGRARLERYQVAAKTGTAQVPRPDGQGYEADKFLHSFFGYFPASRPRFSIFLYALEPVGAAYASQTLTSPFSNLTKFLLNYYQVPPDR